MSSERYNCLGGLEDVVRAGNEEDLSGSDIVIMTAGVPWRYISSRMELLKGNVPNYLRYGEKDKMVLPWCCCYYCDQPGRFSKLCQAAYFWS